MTGERRPLSMSNKRWRGYSSLFTGTSSSQQQQQQQQEQPDDGGGDEPNSMEMSPSLTAGNAPPTEVVFLPQSSNDETDDYVLPNKPPSAVYVSNRKDAIHSSADNDESYQDLDIEDAIDRLGMGRFQYLIVLACGLCFAADAMEILLLSFLAVVLQAEWGLSEGQVDSIISVVFAGAMLGTLVLSGLGDRWGRRPVFGLTAALISIFGVGTAFCMTYEQIVLARFLVGFGVGGLTVPYDALSEFMPTSYRGTNLLSTSFFWTGGSLLVPFFAWLTLGSAGNNESAGSWRAFVTLCALPCILSTILGIFLVPESPRWLLTRGKNEKAIRILRQAAAKNGRDPYLAFPARTRLVDHAAMSELRSLSTTTSLDNEGKGINHEPPEKQKNDCWILCSNPQWRKMTLLLGGQWYGLAFMYYGAIMAISIVFSDASNEPKNAYTDSNATPAVDTSESEASEYAFDYGAILISSSAEIIGLTLAILTVDRFGRVSTQAWSYFLGGLCMLVLGLLDFYVGGDVKDEVLATEAGYEVTSIDQEEQQEERRHLLFFAFLARMFIMAATSITWLHTSELLPTEIRATGHGLANAMGRIGGITSPFIISESTSLRTIGIVMCLVSSTTSIFTRCLPETSGRALGDFDDGNGNVELEDEPASLSSAGRNDGGARDDDDDDASPPVEVEDDKDASSFELL